MMSTTDIRVEISPGELLDKVSILEIKIERIPDETKLAHVRVELEILRQASDALPSSEQLQALYRELKNTNAALWVIEDDIRDNERAGDFGDRFVELARSVYRTNDRRATLKRQINDLLGSRIVEEKSYAEY